MTAPGKPGCAYLFGTPGDPGGRLNHDEKGHHSYAHHICNEVEVEEPYKGSVRRRWKERSENTHWSRRELLHERRREHQRDSAAEAEADGCSAGDQTSKKGGLPMSSKRPGRPKGSTNIAAAGEVEPSRCPACGSSRRTKYENPDRRDYSQAGLEYIAIIYRTCRCLDCGQARRDQEKVYAPSSLTHPDEPDQWDPL